MLLFGGRKPLTLNLTAVDLKYSPVEYGLVGNFFLRLQLLFIHSGIVHLKSLYII